MIGPYHAGRSVIGPCRAAVCAASGPCRAAVAGRATGRREVARMCAARDHLRRPAPEALRPLFAR